MPLFDPTQGGTPQLNQPVLYNSGGTVYMDTWKGNLPSGHELLSQEQAQQQIQQNISDQQVKMQRYNPGTSTYKALEKGIAADTQKLNEVSTLSGAYDPATVGGAKYVIGPNGNLMTEESAANYMPSPQELAAGVKPTGEYATAIESGEYIIADNGAIVPKGSAGALNQGQQPNPNPPAQPLASANIDPTLAAFNQQMVNGIQPPSSNLQPGDTGDEVKRLQDYLVSIGYMTQAQVDTGYGTYGPQTTAAVSKLQTDLGVDTSAGGVGYWGPKTQEAAKTIPPVVNTTTATSTTGTVDPEIQAILDDPNLTQDQKDMLVAVSEAVALGDEERATALTESINAASEFSDPYFKAQVQLVNDALAQGITAKEGDLAYQETSLKNALDKLIADTAATSEYLTFQQTQELNSLARKYEADLARTRDDLAATGFTSSSKRVRSEEILGQENAGLIESTNKKYSYELDKNASDLVYKTAETNAQIADLQRQTEEDKLALTTGSSADIAALESQKNTQDISAGIDIFNSNFAT